MTFNLWLRDSWPYYLIKYSKINYSSLSSWCHLHLPNHSIFVVGSLRSDLCLWITEIINFFNLQSSSARPTATMFLTFECLPCCSLLTSESQRLCWVNGFAFEIKSILKFTKVFLRVCVYLNSDRTRDNQRMGNKWSVGKPKITVL